MLVVVIGGPIASGKSTLARAVGARLEEAFGFGAAVVDLDLVYEMLDARRRPKVDAALWAQARRVAGRLATALLSEHRVVLTEGDFATDQALREFEDELPDGVEPRLVMLGVSVRTALDRARTDPTRGISRDQLFLSAHYAEFEAEWQGRDVLCLDTDGVPLPETVDAVVEWLRGKGLSA